MPYMTIHISGGFPACKCNYIRRKEKKDNSAGERTLYSPTYVKERAANPCPKVPFCGLGQPHAFDSHVHPIVQFCVKLSIHPPTHAYTHTHTHTHTHKQHAEACDGQARLTCSDMLRLGQNRIYTHRI